MNNVDFIFEYQNMYESLKYFSIQNNKLILHTIEEFTIPFTNVILSNLNPSIFLLKPEEILHILYALELLPKENLSESEIEFIKGYTERYLKLNDRALQESDIDQNLIYSLGIPIYLASDPIYENYPSCNIIQNALNLHNEELENGRGKQKRLVLELNSNPNFIQEIPEDNLHNFEKAGFATLFLISSAVIATCSYIIYFIVNS